MTMGRISYRYDEERLKQVYKAEEWITDEYAVNKKNTKLYPVSAKFRRKTIDRKDQIFETIRNVLKD
jgi:colicin import membrane protein